MESPRIVVADYEFHTTDAVLKISDGAEKRLRKLFEQLLAADLTSGRLTTYKRERRVEGDA